MYHGHGAGCCLALTIEGWWPCHWLGVYLCPHTSFRLPIGYQSLNMEFGVNFQAYLVMAL